MSQRLSLRMSSSSMPQVGVDRVVARRASCRGTWRTPRRGGPRPSPASPRSTWRRSTARSRRSCAVQSSAPCSPCMNWLKRPVLALDAELRSTPCRPSCSTGVPSTSSACEPQSVPAAAELAATTFSGSTSIDQSRSVVAVPLRGLGLLVELVERRARALLVVPREDGVGVVGDGVERPRRRRCWSTREDGLEVVDVVAADELLVGRVLGHVRIPGSLRRSTTAVRVMIQTCRLSQGPARCHSQTVPGPTP